jgi:hypothetical protein
MKLNPILPVVLLPLAAACAPSPANEARDIRAPAAAVTGESVSCLTTTNIRNTKVWGDYTIDFEMRDGSTYRNTLDVGCPELGFEQRFAYKTSVSRLCSSDTITVLRSNGDRGASCGLGRFVPVEVAQM